jgi:hypothetical protein
MDMFDGLLDIDKTLVSWIIQTSPSDPDDTAQEQAMQQVLASRGDVEKALNALIAYRLQLAAAKFADDTKRMGTIAAQLDKVDVIITEVETVITLAGQAVQIATKTIAVFVG